MSIPTYSLYPGPAPRFPEAAQFPEVEEGATLVATMAARRGEETRPEVEGEEEEERDAKDGEAEEEEVEGEEEETTSTMSAGLRMPDVGVTSTVS